MVVLQWDFVRFCFFFVFCRALTDVAVVRVNVVLSSSHVLPLFSSTRLISSTALHQL